MEDLGTVERAYVRHPLCLGCLSCSLPCLLTIQMARHTKNINNSSSVVTTAAAPSCRYTSGLGGAKTACTYYQRGQAEG